MRFKIVVRHEIDSFGEIVGVEYCVVSVNADGFERLETDWTRSKIEAIYTLDKCNGQQAVAA